MELYNYQKNGVAFLTTVGSGLLADEVGCGKTPMALAACEIIRITDKLTHRAEPGRVLILCPAILKEQWKAEIRKFYTEATATVVSGTQAQRITKWTKQTRYIIANYELLLRDWGLIASVPWDVIICDEATRISNPRAKQTKAVKKLQTRYKFALTGTPFNNNVENIWSIFDWLRPGILGNWWQFINTYCVKNYWNAIVGYRNLDEMRECIRPYMLRRTKAEVLTELPEIISTDISLELSDKEKKLYNQIKQELLLEIAEGDVNKIENITTVSNAMVKMVRLKQLTCGMELLGEVKESTKLNALHELLPTWINGERKAIIFTQFSKFADILERELAEYKPLKITGEVKNRDEILNAFKDDVKHRILISTSAGQYGLNIQAASVVVHMDQEWSLGKMEQRIGRAHRVGQKQTVLEYSLVCKGTIDMYVRRVLRKKQELSDFMIGVTEIKEILIYEE